MNTNERFGQIEALMADMLRRLDQMLEHMTQQNAQLLQQGQRIQNIDEQIGDIINILKISDARHTQAEERQDAMLAEIRAQNREIQKQSQQIDKQSQQIDKQGQHIDEQGQRTDAALEMLSKTVDLMSYNATRTDALEKQMPVVLSYETRFQRLEEAVFKKAS